MSHTKHLPSPKKRAIFKTLLLYFAASGFSAGSITTAYAAPNEAEPPPFSVTGHGAFYDSKGQRVQLTLDYAKYAQNWYINAVLKKLPKDKIEEFKKLEYKVSNGLKAQTQDALLLRHVTLEHFLQNNQKENTKSKALIYLRAIKGAMRWKLPEYSQKENEKFIALEPHKISRSVLERINELTPKDKFDSDIFKLTTNKGQDYIDECQAAGVPIPPPINQMDPTGLSGWRSEGFIPQADQFIVGSPAELRSYRSLMPRGMCYSLPRYSNYVNSTNNTASLDGVICLAEQSSRACFWDNQWTPPGATAPTPFNIDASDIIPIGVPDTNLDPLGRYQAGGAEIEFASGGECTDCHAGENPFIVHPDSTLRTNTTWSDIKEPAGDLPTYSVNRYVPLVAASWPQNDASLTSAALAAATNSCDGCHKKGSAGRIPHLSNLLPGYCYTVLSQAGQDTMPTYNTGSETANVNALINAYCNAAPNDSVKDVGDPHITTVNGIRYDFQAAGEFTMLTNENGSFELQTRQTPVTTTFTPGANAYTGLASCPSLNTAVGLRVGKSVISYQPKGGQLSSNTDMQLYVNGTPINSVVNLGLGGGNTLQYAGAGSTLKVSLADGSKVRIKPKYWSSQGYWYLNVYVDDTYARRGVMGAIGGGDWLPAAPDGTSFGAKPVALIDRHILLNMKFADAWRVTDKTSLFYYAPGTTTMDFTDANWPAPPGGSCENTTLPGQTPFVKRPHRDLAKEVCGQINDPDIQEACMVDVTVMGETDAALVHLEEAKAL